MEPVEDLDQPLEKAMDELMDGDILVFQQGPVDPQYSLPTAKDYFRSVISVIISVIS